MEEERTQLPSVRGKPLLKGYDPRRAAGGVPRAVLEARKALVDALPAAKAKLIELMACGDQKIELAAAIEVCDRAGLLKLKETDTVTNKMRDIFAKLREKLDERTYLTILEAIAEGEQHAALAGKEE